MGIGFQEIFLIALVVLIVLAVVKLRTRKS